MPKYFIKEPTSRIWHFSWPTKIGIYSIIICFVWIFNRVYKSL